MTHPKHPVGLSQALRQQPPSGAEEPEDPVRLSTPRLHRRAFLRASHSALLGSGIALLSASPIARALGQRPYHGVVPMALPWPVTQVDPHDLYDGTAALFGPSITDCLYAWDARGNPYPTLANGFPKETSTGCSVTLRPGLISNTGAAITTADVIASLLRSSAQGGEAWLAGIRPRSTVEPGVIQFDGVHPLALATRLASPIAAIVPRGYSPKKPNGTGAFEMITYPQRTILKRNPRAARGPAFVDAIQVTTTQNLQQGLRAFEVGDSEIGWLGMYLHRPRLGARAFDAGSVGWVSLRTGTESGVGPGVAQAILDGLPPHALAHFGLGELPAQRGVQGWHGKPCSLLVAAELPYLRQLGQALAELLSRPGHEVRVQPIPVAELTLRRSSGRYALMLDIVRKLGPSPTAIMISLLSAIEPSLARRPPRLQRVDPRHLLRTHSMGVLGEFRIAGALAPNLHNLGHWQLGSLWKS